MEIHQCQFCGAVRSNKLKLFTASTLRQHIKDAHEVESDDPDFEMTELLIDDDMPDGAYFAIAWELGELF